MEISSSKVPSISIKAKVSITKELKEPEFEFERLIQEHYRRFPRTAALVENPKYAKALMNPLSTFFLVPIAIFKVKLNTILSLKWTNYFKLWIFLIIFSIPNTIFMYLTFKADKILGDITFSVIIPILVSVLFAMWYMKFTHDGYFGLILEKKVEWLEKPVKEYYNRYYDKRFSLNLVIVILALITGIGINIPVLIYALSQANQAAFVFGIISCLFNPIIMYIFYLSIQYTILNTRIYSRVLKTIKNKINVYLEEYGTLLNTENYEIIWALGDTPGRSIRQLENIPIAGVLSALIVTIAMVMGVINQFILGIVGGQMPTVSIPLISPNPLSLTAIIVIISLLIAAIMVTIVVFPLYIFRGKMRKFKIKALMELDNYIFASVMEFEQKYTELAKRETVTIFSLREYISSMRTIPISTGKIIKSITAVAVWFANVRKIIKAFS
ncbi:MAG: hypothetical protein ACTSQE_07805 [Candidatus Heimdallarchaeaceae archaeon]